MANRVSTVRKIIREDMQQYPIPESVEATFVNIGDNDVAIDEYVLAPGEPYRVGVIGFVSDAMSFKIEFKGKIASRNKVLLLYGSPTNC